MASEQGLIDFAPVYGEDHRKASEEAGLGTVWRGIAWVESAPLAEVGDVLGTIDAMDPRQAAMLMFSRRSDAYGAAVSDRGILEAEIRRIMRPVLHLVPKDDGSVKPEG